MRAQRCFHALPDSVGVAEGACESAHPDTATVSDPLQRVEGTPIGHTPPARFSVIVGSVGGERAPVRVGNRRGGSVVNRTAICVIR